MTAKSSTRTFVHLRRCVTCGEPFGALHMECQKRDDGLEVREFVYSTRSLPLTDHVHDDSNQDPSYLRSPAFYLESRRPTDHGRVRSSNEKRVIRARRSPQEIGGDWLDLDWQVTAGIPPPPLEDVEGLIEDLIDTRNELFLLGLPIPGDSTQ